MNNNYYENRLNKSIKKALELLSIKKAKNFIKNH